MKLERGLNLSQFVDFIKCNPYLESNKILIFIWLYNDFLKQPLKKEMFINEVRKPDKGIYDETQRKKWEAAEKKVIFKWWNTLFKEDNFISFANDDYQIIFYINDKIIFSRIYEESQPEHIGYIKTLSDIFQATNGELITQNITL